MNNRLAVYDINDFILNGTPVGRLLGWPGASLRPILPIQQQPEMNDENPVHPYMVYVIRSYPNTEQWWIQVDEVTFTIWGKSLDELNRVGNELMDIFRRLDESAEEVNDYLRAKGGMDYEFYYVRVLATLSPEATNSEGGRYGKPFTIRYEYAPLAGRSLTHNS